jgi:hypothetical protein
MIAGRQGATITARFANNIVFPGGRPVEVSWDPVKGSLWDDGALRTPGEWEVVVGKHR